MSNDKKDLPGARLLWELAKADTEEAIHKGESNAWTDRLEETDRLRAIITREQSKIQELEAKVKELTDILAEAKAFLGVYVPGEEAMDIYEKAAKVLGHPFQGGE